MEVMPPLVRNDRIVDRAVVFDAGMRFMWTVNGPFCKAALSALPFASVVDNEGGYAAPAPPMLITVVPVLLATSMPAPPAAWTLPALITNEQYPRSTRTILPVTLLTSGLHASVSVPAVVGFGGSSVLSLASTSSAVTSKFCGPNAAEPAA